MPRSSCLDQADPTEIEIQPLSLRDKAKACRIIAIGDIRGCSTALDGIWPGPKTLSSTQLART
jgi:hypothetical protein